MSTNRTRPGGWVHRTAARGPNGRGICRWCGGEVGKGRRTFCNDDCVHQWRLRSDPGYLRERVFARDRGICSICSLDTVKFFRRFKALPRMKRQQLGAPLGISRSRRSFWDADHIVPVVEGGGECDLDNLRTLCLWCHQEQTSSLRNRLKQKPSLRSFES